MNALSLRVLCARTDAHVTSRVSVGAGGTQANGHSFASALSKAGRFVAFESQASNLVPSDTNTFAFNARGTVIEQTGRLLGGKILWRETCRGVPVTVHLRSRLIRRPVGKA